VVGYSEPNRSDTLGSPWIPFKIHACKPLEGKKWASKIANADTNNMSVAEIRRNPPANLCLYLFQQRNSYTKAVNNLEFPDLFYDKTKRIAFDVAFRLRQIISHEQAHISRGFHRLPKVSL
jgi:hypothetical protein